MSEESVEDDETEPKKASKLPLILGVVLALVGGAGGFFAVNMGLVPGLGAPKEDVAAQKPSEDEKKSPVSDVAFVEVPPLVVSLGKQDGHLRFVSTIEVPKGQEDQVATLMPRIQDVLNTYLRALKAEDIVAEGALIRLRAQMLRRIQLVVGRENVRDLLVMEFVLS